MGHPVRLHESPHTFLELIQATAAHIRIPAVHVEKDYWVTRVLKRLHESDYRDAVVFKSGTSLSKAHRLIERFSEYIDLALTRDEGLSDSRRRRLIRSIDREITQDPRYRPEHPKESKHGRFRKTAHAFSIRSEFRGNFKDMVYADSLPDDTEVLACLAAIGSSLTHAE